MRILVIGGTGTMGGPLVKILSQRENVDVFAVCKHYRKSCENVTYIIGDAYNDEFLKSEILKDKYDAIIDFLWYTEMSLRNRVDILLTSCSHYICLSSAAVYSDSDGIIDELHPRFIDVMPNTEGCHQYHLEKARVENVVRNSNKSNWSIIRPHVTFGDKHLPLCLWGDESWLFLTLNRHSIVLPESLLDKKTNYTSGYDVAKMICMLLMNKDAMGETFNVVSDRVVTNKELIMIYTKVLSEYGFNLKVKYIKDLSEWETHFPESVDRITFDRNLNRVFLNRKIKSFKDVIFGELEEDITVCVGAYLDRWTKGWRPDVPIKHIMYQLSITGENIKTKELKSFKNICSYLKFKYTFLKPLFLAFKIPRYILRKARCI